jgi:hypothetical protein
MSPARGTGSERALRLLGFRALTGPSPWPDNLAGGLQRVRDDPTALGLAPARSSASCASSIR